LKPELFPDKIKPYILPQPSGELIYNCLGCGLEFPIEKLHYTCPECGQVLLIQDRRFQRLKEIPPETWHRIFDYRKMLTLPAMKGIYRFHEFIGSIIPLDAVVYLGEGHTPIIEANLHMQEKTGCRFFFKNDGQNPSASFKRV